jgi:hypothetical protein
MGAYEDGYNDALMYQNHGLKEYLEKLGFGTYDTAYYLGRYRSGTSIYDIIEEIDAKIKSKKE